MRAIYEPSGPAREYAELAVNLYTGCRHGCRYCYCPAVMRKTLADWTAAPKPRKGILEQLRRDVTRLAGDRREVLLSFMADPYQSIEAAELTRQAIQIMGGGGLRGTILTKGGVLASFDFDLLARYGWRFGTSLVFDSDADQQEWEPGAWAYSGRLAAIHSAKRWGIPTWVSMEPVIDPAQSLRIMRTLVGGVDAWKIGKLNHDRAREDAIDWRAFLAEAREILAGQDVYLKRDLLKAAGEEPGSEGATR